MARPNTRKLYELNSAQTPVWEVQDTSNKERKLTATPGSTVAYRPVVANATGLIFFKGAQTIDMADAQYALTLAAATSNILYVDPNSTGGTEDFLLPPEASCDGLMFVIVNTAGGAESIVVCDGTTWRGVVSTNT